MYDLNIFLDRYRSNFGRLRQSQIEGIKFLFGKLTQSKRIDTLPKRAYVLATVQWETAHTFKPITEYGTEEYLKSKPYYPYIGRGYVQITWKENYKKFGDALKIDLVNNPHLANNPEIAWKILEIGMTDEYGIQDPNFTKYTLDSFINDKYVDFYNARKIINPNDKKSYKPIADNSVKMLICLKDSMIKANEKIHISANR